MFKGKAFLSTLILTVFTLLVILAYFIVPNGYAGARSVLGETESLASVLPGVVIALTNTDRVKNGSLLLVENPLLTKAAQMKADDMLARQYYAHVTPEGNTPLYFFDMVGYKYLNAGENLDLTYVSTAEDVHMAWMNSPAHRANLLLPQYTEIGVGVAEGNYQGYSVTFVVEMLATPLPPSPVSKVAPTSLPSVSTNAATPPAPVKTTPKAFTPVIPVSSPPSVQTSLATFVSTSTEALPPILDRVVSQAVSSSLPLPTLIISASSTENAVELLAEFKHARISFKELVRSFFQSVGETASHFLSKISKLFSRGSEINILTK